MKMNQKKERRRARKKIIAFKAKEKQDTCEGETERLVERLKI